MSEPRLKWDHLFLVVYYKNGRLSVTLLLQRRKRVNYDPNRIKSDFLESHNKYRRMHSATELELDENLCVYAQEWAEALAVANGLQYRKNSSYGENVMCMYSSNPDYVLSGRLPVDTWYDEKNDYTFGTEPNSLRTGHFTQIVWKDSKKVGVGWAKSKEGFIYIVANYYPPGNREGEFTNNVANVEGVVAGGIIPSVSTEPQQISGIVTDQSKPEAVTDTTPVSDQLKPTPVADTTFTAEQPKPEAIDDEIPITTSDKVAPVPKILSTGVLHVPQTPTKQRPKDVPDDVMATRQKAEEMMEVIEKVDKADPHSISETVKEVKERAEQVVKAIEKIKTDTEDLKNVQPVDVFKQKAQEVVRTLQVLKQLKSTKKLEQKEADPLDEAQQGANEMLSAVEELQEERDHAVHLRDRLDEAKQTIEKVVDTINEIDANLDKGEEIPDVVDNLKQKAEEVKQAVQAIEEEKEHVAVIPEVLDKVTDTAKDISDAIEKIKADEDYAQAAPGVADEAGEKLKEVAEEIDKINQDEEVATLRKVAEAKQVQNDFLLNCLEAHNRHREKHKVPALKLNMELTKASQAFAEDLGALGLEKNFLRVKYGENLCYYNTDDPNTTLEGDECVNDWYGEIEGYQFGIEPPNPEERSHFTQLVWKTSTDMGAGIFKSDKRIVVVCLYMPPGNILGYFAENVPPVGGFVRKKAGADVDLSFTYVEDNFKDNLVRGANKYRKRHGAVPLILDEEISQDSQELAEKMAEKDVFEHRTRSPYGTLMFGGRSTDPAFKASAKSTVDSWYSDSKGYDFTREPANLDRGNFSQLVWKRSRKIGIGYAKNKKSGSIYIVADFSPPGNYKNEYVKNVSDVVDERVRQALRRGEAVEESETELQYVPSVKSLDKYQSDGVFTPFQLYGLDVHNEYRKLHGVPPLKLNKEICDFAKEWAQENLRLNKMFHRPDNKYGENIYTMYTSDTSRDPSARVAVKAWYDEIVDYNFDNEDIDFTTLHFTQMIWRDSREVGIDWVKNDSGNSFVVANYFPRGNVMNRFRKNVPRPLTGPYSE